MDGIAVAGSLLVDSLNTISAYPKEGELTQISKCEKAVGGCVPNVSVDLKKLSPNTFIQAIGKVGNDENAIFLNKVLTENQVDVSQIKVTNCTQTSFTQVMSVEEGSRTFFTFAGASSQFGFDDIDFEKLNVKMLHLGYFLLLDKIDNGDGEKILKKATEMGIKTSIDLVSENSNRYKLVLPCLKYTDNLIINEVEAGNLTGKEPTVDNLPLIARELKELGVRERVIIHAPTFGVCLSKDGYTILPSYDIPNSFIKGTTGAGDAFCAGALLSIYRNLSDKEILEIASTCALNALTSVDATSGICEVEKIMEEYKNLKRRKLC